MNKIDCVFCNFGHDLSLIPYQLLSNERNDFIMLSLNPQNKGHLLIVPKAHFSKLIDISQNQIAALFNKAIKYGEILQKKLGAKAYVIKVNNRLYQLEKDQGHIAHLHIHVIPRYKKDEKIINHPPTASVKSLLKAQQILKG